MKISLHTADSHTSRASVALLAILVLPLLSSCANKLPSTTLQSIQIVAEVNANQSSATALDLVFVYDSNSLSLMPKNGPQWFEQKAALNASLASAVDVLSLQIIPASVLTLPNNPAFPARYKKAVGVYAYANYVSPGGQLVANLTPYGAVEIRLTPDNVTVSGQPPLSTMQQLLNKISGK